MNLSVVYHISQSSADWKSAHYRRQMDLLESSGLYPHVDSLHVHVTEHREHLDWVPDRTTDIHYYRDGVNAGREIMLDTQQLAQKRPQQKILYWHSDSVAQAQNQYQSNRQAWTGFLEFCNIQLWHKAVELLDFYDCVGADYVNYAGFDGDIRIWAPHYTGMFWWATANYLRRLDAGYLDQDVAWKPYLPELWIGSSHPRGFMMMRSDVNPFLQTVEYDRSEILQGVTEHLAMLRKPNQRY